MVRKAKPTGITHRPLPREEEQQRLVPPKGQSIIGKGRNRKPVSPKTRRRTFMQGSQTGASAYRTNTQDLDWSEERADQDREPNIGDWQRLLSAIAGVGMVATGLARRSAPRALLALAGGAFLYRAATGYCHALGLLGVDMKSGAQDTNRLGRRKIHSAEAAKIRRTIEVNRPPADIYRFWRSLDNLPRVMSHLDSVHVINDRLSHWVVKTKAETKVEWDAEIINDVENERIGWRSLNDADVANTGSVEFEPIGDGLRTKVTVTLQYAPPAGKLGVAVAQLIGDPDSKIAQDLQRFKESMEAGV